MARTPITVTTILRDGVDDPVAANGDTVNGHSIDNAHGDVWLEVDNVDDAVQNLTVRVSRTVDGQAAASRVYPIDAAAERFRIGPWPVADYGRLLLVDAASADLKIRALRLGR